MGCKAARELSEYLSFASSLVNLRLGWNKIRANGGVHICEALKESKRIRNVDLSWNILNATNPEDPISL